MLAGDDVLASCDGDNDVRLLHRLQHRHDIETVHLGLDGPDRVNLGDDDVGAQSLGAHGHTFAAPSIPSDDQVLSRYQQVRGVHPTVEGGLPSTIPVVEKVLHLGVVDRHDRKLQLAFLGHGP